MSTVSVSTTSGSAYTQTGDLSGNLSFVASNNIVNLASNSGAVAIPSGTTAQRPASPVNATLRYNTDLSKLELYFSGAWVSFP